jgi:hypothetical protein
MKKEYLAISLLIFSWVATTNGAANLQSAGTGFSDEAKRLKEGIHQLAENSKATAKEYADVVGKTIHFGQSPDAGDRFYSSTKEANKDESLGEWYKFIDDSFAVLDEGEKKDSSAADWARLREELKKLKPPTGTGPTPEQKNKNKNDQKKDKNSGQGKKDSQGDKGNQDKKDGQKGEKEGEGQDDSQSPPSHGKGGQGKDGEGSSENSGENQPQDGDKEGKGQKEAKGKSKDPNGVKDFSSSKEGEGKMRDRAKEDDLNPIQDKGAGFGDLAKEKKDQEKKAEAVSQASVGTDKKENQKEAPAGMRMVGGGTGKKEKDGFNTPSGLEAMARLDQVRQSDSPALLQQRLQPKDQQPSPGVSGKPW